MPSIKGTKTEKNLLAAFAGESQARNRYEMYAKKAKKEGYVQISEIFQDTADNEYQHAKRFFSFLEGGEAEIVASYPAGKVGTTLENLKESAGGEHHEHAELYPMFAQIAKEEGFPEVSKQFKAIAMAEVSHEERFLKLIDIIEKDIVFKRGDKVYWRCSKCGYIHEGTVAPQECPSCKHPTEYFFIHSENF